MTCGEFVFEDVYVPPTPGVTPKRGRYAKSRKKDSIAWGKATAGRQVWPGNPHFLISSSEAPVTWTPTCLTP